jgi:ABC-2 type transport system ATP-binding protein
MEEHPMQILIRCDRPAVLAARIFEQNLIVEARLHRDAQGLFVKVQDPDRFYLGLNQVVLENSINVESVAPVDDDLNAVYQYLIGTEGGNPS